MINIGNCELGRGVPKVCIPVTCRDSKEIKISYIKDIKLKEFDLLEFRVDYIENVQEIKNALKTLKSLSRKPVIFTCRTISEGGLFSGDDQIYYELNKWAITSGLIDCIDIEFSKFKKERAKSGESVEDYVELLEAEITGMTEGKEHETAGIEIEKIVDKNSEDIESLKSDERQKETIGEILVRLAREYGVAVILSEHDFEKTPGYSEILVKMVEMKNSGADIPKVAYMAKKPKDVANVIYASTSFVENYEDDPCIAISMGPMGVATRVGGEVFGSSMTYACSEDKNNIGQIGITKTNSLLKDMHKMIIKKIKR